MTLSPSAWTTKPSVVAAPRLSPSRAIERRASTVTTESWTERTAAGVEKKLLLFLSFSLLFFPSLEEEEEEEASFGGMEAVSTATAAA